MHKSTHLKVELLSEVPLIKYTPQMFGFKEINGTGKGTKICIADGGFPMNKCVKNIHTVANFTSDKEPSDYQGKSTVVAGILTGESVTFSGMCPDSDLYIAKSINNSGLAQFDAAIAAVLWGIIQAVDIIVIPTELEDSCDILANAVNKAIDNNIVVVMAGSDGYSALSVRNTKDTDSKQSSCFLSSKVIYVKGDNIHSTFLNDKFAICHGVSCSVAIISGVLSRLIEQNKSQNIRYNPKFLLTQLMQSVMEI